MLFVILLTLSIGLVLVFIKNLNKDYWKKRGIVQVDSNAWHFILGKCSLSEIYKHIYDSHPNQDCVGTFVGFKPVLILKNLEDIQAVLQSDFQSFYGRGYKTNPKDTLADNLLLIDDYARWRLLRQKISPVFTTSKLKHMFSTIDRCASDFTEYIQFNKHAQENFFEALHTYISASTSASVFGINSQSQNTMVNPILNIGWNSTESLLVFNIKFALSNIFPKLFNFLNLKAFGKHKDFVVEVTRKVLRSRRETQEKRHDYIDACLEMLNQGLLHDPSTGYTLEATDEILAAQAFSLFVAGVDTTANLMNFILLELSNNPDILKRLHDEIDKVFENCKGNITHEELRKMEYLEMVINEAMRKYPPIGLMQRMCMKDTVLPVRNISIKKNTFAIIPIYGIHTDKKYFPKPEVFDPERFSPVNVPKIVKLSYMPFGEGYRICIGKICEWYKERFGINNVNFFFKMKVSFTLL